MIRNLGESLAARRPAPFPGATARLRERRRDMQRRMRRYAAFAPRRRSAAPLFAALLPLFCAAALSGRPRFENAAAEAGLLFTLDNHATARKRLIETMAGGVAAFDYDGDGFADIFFTNGAAGPALVKSDEKFLNRLFRNEGGRRFRDVTAEAGVGGAGYSMGAAAADFDNDGDSDLFVAGVFRNLLYRNEGDGSFADVTASSGIASDRWSVAAGWFDYDRDGLLDLFVVNYAEWSVEEDRFCGDRAANLRVYCHPQYFAPIANRLYRNLGGGRFADVSAAAGIAAHKGRGMSVAFADYDADGSLDVFVTNDNLPNFLFRNDGGGAFEEDALLGGAALLDHGKPVASMGADFRDYDNDGRPDIHVTALSGETFPLFRNEGDGFFSDATFSSGIAKAVADKAGWCNGFVDFDNDGDKDLFAANAHVNDLVERTESYRYVQTNSLLENDGGRFADRSAEAGFADAAAAHRGCAFADFDNDGLIDIVVSSLNAPAELWRNTTATRNHWARFKLVGRRSNRGGFGARVRIGGQWNEAGSAVGYASSSHAGVHFGLGPEAALEEVEILWPSGVRQILRDVAVDRVVTVREPDPGP